MNGVAIGKSRVARRQRTRTLRPMIELMEDRVLLATFTVNSAADPFGLEGTTTLRQAIDESNDTPGLNTINFAIPGPGVHTISPLSALPEITDPVIIDGYTQPGASPNSLSVGDNAMLLIVLDGSLAGQYADGLEITAGGSTVRGLVIDHFREGPNSSSPTGFSGGHGIYLLNGGGNTIEGNFIGTDSSGTVAAGNEGVGVLIESSPNNLVGGLTPAARNLIAGNPGGAIDLDNFSGPDAPGNLIQNNYINTDKSGTRRLGGGSGVNIASVSDNTVGGSVVAARNIISGGDFSGVVLQAGATSNLVQGNFIGTDATGSTALGNARYGVIILNSPGNTVGGTVAAARNIISSNDLDGVNIEGSPSVANLVQGNFIGTDASGTTALGNARHGVSITHDNNSTNPSGSDNTIGGTAAGAGNLISGNGAFGVVIFGPNGGASGNLVQGNFIGTGVNGTKALGNKGDGVVLSSAPNNTIGGTTAVARNVISGNGKSGVVIERNPSSGNLVQGNFIGTDVNGTKALGNASHGVIVQLGASNNTIGGTGAGAGNVISRNGNDGVLISSASNNAVLGNFIGTNAAGTAALGNTLDGISLNDASNNRIIGNVVSGNGINQDAAGIDLESNDLNNIIAGNKIGTNAAGTAALGNSLHGIFLGNGSSNNTIGGTMVSDRNVISGDGKFPVADFATQGGVEVYIFGANTSSN